MLWGGAGVLETRGSTSSRAVACFLPLPALHSICCPSWKLQGILRCYQSWLPQGQLNTQFLVSESSIALRLLSSALMCATVSIQCPHPYEFKHHLFLSLHWDFGREKVSGCVCFICLLHQKFKSLSPESSQITQVRSRGAQGQSPAAHLEPRPPVG